MSASVRFWSALLGDPTFTDEDRWAQFDVGSTRLSLGAGVEDPGATTVMIKVDELEDAVAELNAAGIHAGAIEEGSHERRVRVSGPTGEAVLLYRPAAN